jgi:hypothetical protein
VTGSASAPRVSRRVRLIPRSGADDLISSETDAGATKDSSPVRGTSALRMSASRSCFPRCVVALLIGYRVLLIAQKEWSKREPYPGPDSTVQEPPSSTSWSDPGPREQAKKSPRRPMSCLGGVAGYAIDHQARV